MIKLLIVGRRRPGTTLAQHRHHIRYVHGALVQRYIALSPESAPQRYVQNAVFDGSFRCGAPAAKPFTFQCDYVTQIWCNDLPSLSRSREHPFYLEHLRPDEARFVDEATVVFLPVREQLVSETADVTESTVKFFAFSRSGAGPNATSEAGWLSALAELGTTPAGTRVARHVTNEVLSRPGETPPVDRVDEFWLSDENAAQALAEAWQSTVVEPLTNAGNMQSNSGFVLLAHEHVMHPGIGWPAP